MEILKLILWHPWWIHGTVGTRVTFFQLEGIMGTVGMLVHEILKSKYIYKILKQNIK